MARLMGLDIGDRRIGVALSDGAGLIASPHSVYERVGYGPDTRYFLSLAKQHEVAYIVCGLPLNMDGSLGEQALKVQGLCDKLAEAGLDIRYMDERLSTRAAQMALIEGGVRRDGRKSRVDMVAAALILQSWLDSPPDFQAKAPRAGVRGAQGASDIKEDMADG